MKTYAYWQSIQFLRRETIIKTTLELVFRLYGVPVEEILTDISNYRQEATI
jgi:hypothetical protein